MGVQRDQLGLLCQAVQSHRRDPQWVKSAATVFAVGLSDDGHANG